MHTKCPNCNGEIWDNVEANNERALVGKTLRPDYSCKDKDGCGWLLWRPKNGSKKILVSTEPPKPKEVSNGKEDMMRLAYRKDLMICLINLGQSNDFDTYWNKIEEVK